MDDLGTVVYRDGYGSMLASLVTVGLFERRFELDRRRQCA
jgi:hypothetical protein